MTKQEIKEYFATKSQFCEQRDFHLTADTWGIIFEIVENAQQEILDRAIEGQPEKKYSGKHNSAHTYITDGYCHACKKQLTREQMIEEFGYNQAVDDYCYVLSTLKDTNI